MTVAPVFSKGRDLEAAADALGRWLTGRLGTSEVVAKSLSYPQGAGTSNETILFEAQWTGGETELVVRVAPAPNYQMYLEPEFRLQYEILDHLGRKGSVRVPEVLWFEDDPAVLGRPFFIMRRMRGRVPVSMPVYNQTGWLVEASPAQRRTVWESAMGQLAAIHLVPVDEVGFADRPERGRTGAEQQLTYWTRFASWATNDDVPDAVLTILEWLTTNVPTDEPPGLSWGDARMGNMMFGDDFGVLGVMDWEQASLAGGLADLGWWLFFDEIHSVEAGLRRLDGLGSRQETIDLWQELTGRKVKNLLWHEVFAGCKTTLFSLRSRHILNVPAGAAQQANPFLSKAYRLLDLPVPKGVA